MYEKITFNFLQILEILHLPGDNSPVLMGITPWSPYSFLELYITS
jgi:hypothetical protein